MVGYV
jgi:hypothetical protein